MSKAKHVITASLLITLIIGVLNNVYKKNSLPSFRFFFGSGVLFLLLNFMAEWEEELAKNIAIAIAVFTLLGEGGGVLDHFLGKGVSATTLNTQPEVVKIPRGQGTSGAPATANVHRRDGGLNAVHAGVGQAPVKPLLFR